MMMMNGRTRALQSGSSVCSVFASRLVGTIRMSD